MKRCHLKTRFASPVTNGCLAAIAAAPSPLPICTANELARVAPARASSEILAAITSRLRGPGGYYNAGNLLGLAMGIGLQLAGPARDANAGAGATILAYLAGNAPAVATTAATIIFLCAGEIYHRAWSPGGAHDAVLNRLADLLSGLGALALGCALWMLGQPLLAATAGALHALGKLASAFIPDAYRAVRQWPAAWPDPFRSLVVASRVPAILASSIDLWRASAAALAGGLVLPAAMPATLLVCYLLWTRADLLLFEGARRLKAVDAADKTAQRVLLQTRRAADQDRKSQPLIS
jgi:hypothetical protein